MCLIQAYHISIAKSIRKGVLMVTSLSNFYAWFGILVFGSVTFSMGQVWKTESWRIGNNRLFLFIRSVWNELFDLLEAIPYLLLITSASVFFLWNFGRTVLNDEIAFALAVGVEWAYIRGVINSHVGVWGLTLTISAFLTSVLWGVLYVAIENGILLDKVVERTIADGLEKPFPVQQMWISIAHVVPIAWLSICSGLMHREIAMAEKTIRDALEAEAKAEEKLRLAEEKERLKAEQQRVEAIQAEKDRIELERIKQVALDEAEDRRLERERREQEAKALVWAKGEEAKTTAQIRLIEAQAATKKARPSSITKAQKTKVTSELEARVRQQLQIDNIANRRKFADELGIAPGTLYGIIRRIQAETVGQ
jgi:hypothetical protein